MRILVEGNIRPALTRMYPMWRSLGNSVTEGLDCDVQLSCIKIRKFANTPKVLRLDGVIYDKAIDYDQDNWNIVRSYNLADAIVFQSETCKRFCEKYIAKGPIKKPHDIIFNGVDWRNWHNPIEHDQINIVSCANWRRWKRLPEMLKVFKYFRVKYPDSQLHIIGSMRRGAEVIPAENVHYYGKIDFEKMKSIYKFADMYLHLGKNDSCPSSVAEAIAAGIPIVTTNACGGATEMTRMVHGFIANSDYSSIEPQKYYEDEWNKISYETIVELSGLMEQALNWIPMWHEKLNVAYTARRYLDILRSVL
jgi:glycosyltransferase involved in cell wall biosynthesis